MCFPPIEKFCSGVLLGYKIIVPCNVKEVLSTNYGNETSWSYPHVNDYRLENANWGKYETGSAFELPYLMRYYNSKGEIDTETTLSKINKYYFNLTGYYLKRLPKDDDDFI